MVAIGLGYGRDFAVYPEVVFCHSRCTTSKMVKRNKKMGKIEEGKPLAVLWMSPN